MKGGLCVEWSEWFQRLVLLTMAVGERVKSSVVCCLLNTLFPRAFLTCFFVFSIRSTGRQSPLWLGKGRGSLALVVWGCNLWVFCSYHVLISVARGTCAKSPLAWGGGVFLP